MIRRLALLLPLVLCLPASGQPAPEKPAMNELTHVPQGKTRYVVTNKPLHKIDDRLFGHFMERPSWGEIGIEAGVVPGKHELQPSVRRLLGELHMPIVRFPGGTDVDYMDWRDMVDNVPGRGQDRPVSTGHQGHKITNNFGYDEFLRLCAELKAAPIIVVNLGDALMAKKSADDVARSAAALVAYCNMPQGAKRPEGMEDWPAVRAKNGHPAPYGVPYFQIGNETWAIKHKTPDGAALAGDDFTRQHVDCLARCVRAMRAVDPSIRIIADALNQDVSAEIRKQLGDQVTYLVQHYYMPWGLKAVAKDGVPVRADALSAQDVWNAWVAVPNGGDAAGESVLVDPKIDAIRAAGYKAAITEWNWNGGWWGLPADQGKPPLDSLLAKGIGAAGYLHAFMRSGDVIDIACQSMTVGKGWPINCIRADPEGRKEAYFMPSGQVTMFYALHHGDRLLEMEGHDVPTYTQPYHMGGIRPRDKVAYIDALATADDRAIYFHAINRHFSEDLPVTIDLSGAGGLADAAIHHVFEGRLNDKPEEGEGMTVGRFSDRQLKLEGGVLKVTLPKRSVSIIEITRKSAK